MDPLTLTFEVACPVDHAFRTWTADIARWWPRSHSVTAADGLEVVLEPRAGGRIFERTPAGDEHDWGEVLAWEPPHRLTYLWHLRFDRADATEVEITFTAAGAGTRVHIEHRGWERLGSVAEERRDRNRRGWASVTEHYRRVAG